MEDENEYGITPLAKRNKSVNRFFSHYWKYLILIVLALGLIAALIGLGILVVTTNDLRAKLQAKPPTPKNIIFFISDGCGPASMTLARNFVNPAKKLPLDNILVGTSATYSSDSLITDSAAGATAFSCGLKTYNGAIGMDASQKPCGTVLEAAIQQKNKLTGIVATSSITHATPGSFSAHVLHRDMEPEIAAQQINKGINVVFAGGYNFYIPQTQPNSQRTDNVDLIALARSKNMTVITDRAGFDKIDAQSYKSLAKKRPQILGLLAGDSLEYEINRNAALEPSLAEMTKKALDLLTSMQTGVTDAPGFFLIVEGSKIDWAAHDNDAAAHLRDILAYNDAVDVALKFVANNTDTLIISTSDHETGGLTLGADINGAGLYAWYPQVLANVKASTDKIAQTVLSAVNAATTSTDKNTVLRSTLTQLTGLSDITEMEFNTVFNVTQSINTSTFSVMVAINKLINDRARLGWTTYKHTGVDVNLYATGAGAKEFAGSHQNTDIGNIISTFWALNLTAVDINKIY